MEETLKGYLYVTFKYNNGRIEPNVIQEIRRFRKRKLNDSNN